MNIRYWLWACCLLPITAWAETQFTYTSLQEKDCKLTSRDSINLSSIHTCPSLGGYRIQQVAGDERIGLNIEYGKKSLFYSGASFEANVGDKIEWRYTEQGQKKHYHALIFRVYTLPMGNDGLFNQQQRIQQLIVVRLRQNKSCILAEVPSSSNMNEQARAIADNPNAKCLSPAFTM